MGNDEIFTHIDDKGQAHMVDVSDREITTRTATASGKVLLSLRVVEMLKDGSVPKGDVLATARLAGIMGAKRTPDLIPLAHPIALHSVTVELQVVNDGVTIQSSVRTADRTGVEMEALTSVSISALTIIDMVKSLDPSATITDVRVDSKDGGRNGAWKR